MKAKLMKNGTTTYVLVKDGKVVGNMENLSLKNCQAIERGYDLDEHIAFEIQAYIAEKHNQDECTGFMDGYEVGFQKALEIRGDKKFSEEELKQSMWDLGDALFNNCQNEIKEDEPQKYIDFIIQSLQQTEWDVEIVMEFNPINHASGLQPTGNELMDISISQNYKPKLDTDGCLILKPI